MFKGLRKKASILLFGGASLTSDDLDSVISPVTSVGTAGTTSSLVHPNHVKVVRQVKDFEIALQAMDYLLDDRSKEGVKLLQDETSKSSKSDQPAAILPLALGVMEFIEATLGFESEVMTKAHNTLTEAELASLNNQKYNVKHKLVTSHIYPPGTEFQVTYAELTLLNALVMLLRENNGMVEQAKALFKLRKAYHALDAIYKKIKELEPAFKKNLAKLAAESNNDKSVSISTVDLPGFTPSDTFLLRTNVPTASDTSKSSSSASLPEEIKLMKDLEVVYQMRKARIEGTMLKPGEKEEDINLFHTTPPETQASSNLTIPIGSVSKRLLLKSLGSASSGTMTTAVPAAPSTPTISSFSNRPESPMQMLNSRFLKEPEKPNLSSPGDSEDEEDDDISSFASADDYTEGGLDSSQKFFSSSAANGNNCEESLFSETSSSQPHSSNSANNHLHVSTVDEFIHSGVQLCFGILQVVLSLIPPTIGKVLSIVGFRGDRDVGLKMLWRTAITSRNIHGELALLCLLVFYDGPVQFVDVGYQLPGCEDSKVTHIISIDNRASVSDKELDKILKNPSLYTPQLTKRARKHFPHNALWVLQDSRILASRGELQEASELMQNFPTKDIQMQQIEALLVFDRAMLYTFKHQYDEAARDFISLIDINSWSKGVYLFLAACCYLSKMRMIEMDLTELDSTVGDKIANMSKYAKLATKYFDLSPTYIPGHAKSNNVKTGGIGGSKKQMPFDKFVLRKLEQVEARRKQYPKLAFVDCFGTSPIHELIYFWNGYNRMTKDQLELSVQLLGYSGMKGSDLSAPDGSYIKFDETTEESMIRYFIQGIALRLSGNIKEGLSIHDTHVIPNIVTDFGTQGMPFKFNKLTYSPYLYPTVLYERSMFVWMLRSSKQDFNAPIVCHECKEWLRRAEVVADIGDYELSNRTGMRIKAASDRLDSLSIQIS